MEELFDFGSDDIFIMNQIGIAFLRRKHILKIVVRGLVLKIKGKISQNPEKTGTEVRNAKFFIFFIGCDDFV